MQTLYQYGREEILRLITSYLDLLTSTNALAVVTTEHFKNPDWKIFLCGGRGIELADIPALAESAEIEYKSRAALGHDLEAAVSGPLYLAMRSHALVLAEEASRITNGFSKLKPAMLEASPELLPVFLHAAGSFSKSTLAKNVGSISDAGLSKPAAARLSAFFETRLQTGIEPAQIVGRLGSTIEGQVRDLLGRYLLEALVEAALLRQQVPFLREEEYTELAGVVYNHRADFVIPDATDPLIFIEVRKSSARHASLYAKDKMFSAINWKGHNKRLIGVLVIDGPWTKQALLALAHVFDYVLPVTEAEFLATIASDYLSGDTSKLLRLVHFSIEELVAKAP